MNNIMKNTMTLFSRHKEYIATIVKGPILITLIYSFIFAFQSKVNVALYTEGSAEFCSYIESTLEETDLIKLVDVKKEDVESKIQNGKIEFAVFIGEEDSIHVVKSGDSSVANYMEGILNGAVAKYASGERFVTEQNDVGKKGLPIGNSMGIILFKMIASASLLAELLIRERKTGIAQRVSISKTGFATYLTGRGFVFFLNVLLFVVVYFTTAFVFRFDFGMRAPLRMAVLFVVMAVFTTAFGMFCAALLKEEASVWNVGVMVLLPSSVLSGALLPFDAMPKVMQTIGNCFPQRWLTSAVEILQEGGTLADTAKPLAMVLGISLVLFAVSGVKLSRVRK